MLVFCVGQKALNNECQLKFQLWNNVFKWLVYACQNHFINEVVAVHVYYLFHFRSFDFNVKDDVMSDLSLIMYCTSVLGI